MPRRKNTNRRNGKATHTHLQVDSNVSLEQLGMKFLKDVKQPGTEKSAMDDLTAEWAVLRTSDSSIKVFGFASLPIDDTGLFADMLPNDLLVLVPPGNPSISVGREEVACPPELDTAACCVLQ